MVITSFSWRIRWVIFCRKRFIAITCSIPFPCFTTTQIAKELGITAQELNRSLCALHIQYYQSGQYLLYTDYAHMGLAKSRTRYSAFLDPKAMADTEKMGRAYAHTYLVWTERGRKVHP